MQPGRMIETHDPACRTSTRPCTMVGQREQSITRRERPPARSGGAGGAFARSIRTGPFVASLRRYSPSELGAAVRTRAWRVHGRKANHKGCSRSERGLCVPGRDGEMTLRTQVRSCCAASRSAGQPLGAERGPFDARSFGHQPRHGATSPSPAFAKTSIRITWCDSPAALRAAATSAAAGGALRVGLRALRQRHTGIGKKSRRKLLVRLAGNVRELQNCMERAVALTQGLPDLRTCGESAGVRASIRPALEPRLEILPMERSRGAKCAGAESANGSKKQAAATLRSTVAALRKMRATARLSTRGGVIVSGTGDTSPPIDPGTSRSEAPCAAESPCGRGTLRAFHRNWWDK